MAFNYDKLRGKIKEKYKTQAEFAKRLGISRATLSQKLNNVNEFTQQEINNSAVILDIPTEEIPVYFFTLEVRKNENKQEVV